MKTIFRYTNLALLLAAILAMGAVAGFAQDPCTDADGQTAASDKVTELYKDKTKNGKKATVDAGKAFLEKYGACPAAKELADWLKIQIPKMETQIKTMEEAEVKNALLDRFNKSLTSKNWDETYASGKEILQKYGDEFRAVELVLGSIGYDELLDRQIGKYNDETLKFAKQSLADLEAGKEFKPGFGVNPFIYKNKDDAIAWMNLTIGSINQLGQKNKAAALPYLFKATQATGSDVNKNPNPYEFIGLYYVDELNKLVEQIQEKAKGQNDADAADVAQKKVDEIKALVALSNGTSERAMDAFSRAYTLGQAAPYKKKMKDKIAAVYKVRFAKEDGVDAWITTAMTKPFVNPQSPITPISDPEPVATPATTTTTAPGATPATTPGTTTNGKPAATTPAKPGPIKPATPATTKPGPGKQVSVKKATAKKKVA